MTIREKQEQWEMQYLSPYAALSAESKGRDTEEVPCDIRPVYQRDRDRILHSKAFRRLKQKTQVFLSPMGDHYRTRLTHTLEVSQNARTIAKALRLNEDLVEAIALGHDLGHTPFGHAGEHALDSVCENGFRHHEQSVRIVERLEKQGRGLNLTWEVRDGILNHPTAGNPATLEGKIVRLSDKIAYINHDIDDSIRARVLTEEDIPARFHQVLGFTSRERLNTLIHDIVRNSEGKNDIVMSQKIESAMKELREFMFAHVYKNSRAKEEEGKAKQLLITLYQYYIDNIERLPAEFLDLIDSGENEKQVVCDYVAGMSDRYAIHMFQKLFMPKQWEIY